MNRGFRLAVLLVIASAFAGALVAQTGFARPREPYVRGEQELRTGDLADAERDFRAVLSKDPSSAGAHANLGVVYMRRKEWSQALIELRAAEKLAPSVPGIRLNICLLYTSPVLQSFAVIACPGR